MPPTGIGQHTSAEPPTLTVSAVARWLGVAPATLRTWNRRYGLGPSGRSTGSHRRYGPDDLARLQVMRRLTLSGYPPREAARAAAAHDPRATAPHDPHATAANDSPAPLVQPPTDAMAPGRAGGGQVLAMPASRPANRGLARAAQALDAPAIMEILENSLERSGVVWTWDHLLVPVLVGAGRRWELTGNGVETEHLLADCAAAALRATHGKLRRPLTTRPVLLAAADEEQHSLPLHALGAALAERQVPSRNLGARVPRQSLAAAVRRSGPLAVFVWSHLPTTGDPALFSELPATRPAALLLAGGPGWGSPLPPGTVLVDDLSHAVERITATALG